MSEGGVEVFRGADELIVDAASSTASADGVEEVLECAEVSIAECRGVAGELSSVFKPLKTECARVAEFELFIVEDLQNKDVVSTLSERLEALEKVFTGAKKVGEKNDDRSPIQRFVDALQDARNVCFSTGELCVERGEYRLELRVAAAGGNLRSDTRVEDRDTD